MSSFIHRNTLVPSDDDLIHLGTAVEVRFKGIFDLHERLMGYSLAPPSELQNDMVLWRTMVLRHRKGDRRHTNDEKLSTRRVAQWTNDVNRMLRNQPPLTIMWKD